MEKEKKEKQKDDKLRCKKCGKAFVYVRIKDKKVVCRGCGYIGDISGN